MVERALAYATGFKGFEKLNSSAASSPKIIAGEEDVTCNDEGVSSTQPVVLTWNVVVSATPEDGEIPTEPEVGGVFTYKNERFTYAFANVTVALPYILSLNSYPIMRNADEVTAVDQKGVMEYTNPGNKVPRGILAGAPLGPCVTTNVCGVTSEYPVPLKLLATAPNGTPTRE